jgi:hypothetical protein
VKDGQGRIVFEILSNNKKVTIPPSIHPNGMAYRWKGEDLLNYDLEKLPELPPSFISNVKHALQCHSPSTQFDGKKIINGRFDALQSKCGELIKEGKPVDAAVRELVSFDKENHEVAYFEDHTEQYHTEPFTNALKMYTSCLDSFNKRHMERSEEYEIPMLASAIDEVAKEAVSKKKVLQKEIDVKKEGNLTDFDYNLTKESGVLYDIQKFVLSNSFIKQPSFALSAALCLVGTLIGRKLSFSGNATNLYALNVAPSGSGKDAPQQCLKSIFVSLRLENYLGSGDYVSDASLMDTLPSSPVRLDIIDEASGLLKSVNKGANTYDGKMADILCELYTSSSSKFLGRALANGEVRGQVDRPCVSLLMSTTPRGFQESLTIKAVEKGLLGRTLIFQGNSDNPAERVARFTDLKEDAKMHLKELSNFEPLSTTECIIGDIEQKVHIMEADEEASVLLDAYFLEVDTLRRSQNEDSLQLPIIARMFQQLCKIAAIHSASRSLDFIVRKVDVEFAYKLVKANLKHFSYMLNNYIHDSTEDEYIDRVKGYLKRNGDRTIKQILGSVRSNLATSKRRSILEMAVKTELIGTTFSGNKMYYTVDK